MGIISDNIKFLRKQKGYTQEQFSQLLFIKRSLLGAYEEGRADPRLSTLTAIADFFETTVDLLISTDLSQTPVSKWSNSLTRRGKDILAITVDADDNENIEMVPQKAAAGYLNGYADPEFIRELPRFRLPMLPGNATYRAFEIQGDSMLPLRPGTIIVGEYVEDLHGLKNGKCYILVTKDEGIVYKRVFNYLGDNGKLFLVSDNRLYAPFQVKGEDVLEAWAGKAYISVDFPDVNETGDVTTEQLAAIILELQKEIMTLKANE